MSPTISFPVTPLMTAFTMKLLMASEQLIVFSVATQLNLTQ